LHHRLSRSTWWRWPLFVRHPEKREASTHRLPSWPSDGSYFDERWWNTGGSGCRGQVGVYHRILSSYLNALVDAGFEPTSFAEPYGAEALLAG
jgi:hypothetical protein